MVSACTRNARQLVDETLRYLGDYHGAGKEGRVYTRARVLDALNSALREAIMNSRMLKIKVSVISGPDGRVALSESGAILLRAAAGGRVLALANLDDLDLMGVSRPACGDPASLLPGDRPGEFQLVPPLAGQRLDLVVTRRPDRLSGTVDTAVPVWLHIKLKYGAACKILPRSGGTKLEAAKLQLATNKWQQTTSNAAFYWSGGTTDENGVRPL